MNQKNNASNKFDDLRKRAEEIAASGREDGQTTLPENIDEVIHDLRAHQIDEIIHDLRTHQIELEIQNEDLVLVQDQLEELVTKYSDLYEFAPTGYATVSAKGLIEEVNLTLVDLLETDKRTLIKSPLSAFILGTDQDLWYQTFRLLRTEEKQTCELRMTNPRNGEFWARLECTAIHNGTGDFDNIRIAVSDISEQKRLEKELIIAKDRAEIANRAKSEFLANMSHELRTPLYAILSFSDFGVGKYSTAGSDKILSYFERINQSGRILLAVLSDLLDLAKLESGKYAFHFDRCRFSDIMESVVANCQSHTSAKNITIEITDHDREVHLVVDKKSIAQVFQSLLNNAIKFSKESSTIEIGINRVATSLEVTVRDYGIGVPEHETEAVFEKFRESSKTKSPTGGRGLGLAICREIIVQHDGRIRVECRTPGAEFIVSLPIEQCDEANANSVQFAN